MKVGVGIPKIWRCVLGRLGRPSSALHRPHRRSPSFLSPSRYSRFIPSPSMTFVGLLIVSSPSLYHHHSHTSPHVPLIEENVRTAVLRFRGYIIDYPACHPTEIFVSLMTVVLKAKVRILVTWRNISEFLMNM